MYVYSHRYGCWCMHVLDHVCTQMCLSLCTHVYMWVWAFACLRHKVHVYTCLCIYTPGCRCPHVCFICLYVHLWSHAYIHVHKYVCLVEICTHICIGVPGVCAYVSVPEYVHVSTCVCM